MPTTIKFNNEEVNNNSNFYNFDTHYINYEYDTLHQ